MSEAVDAILPILAATPARWTALCATLPAELLRRKPAPGEWSALECLLHLLDTEKFVFPARVRAFLAGSNFPGFNPETQGTRDDGGDPAELAAQLTALRAAALAEFQALTPADLERQAVHAELGPVTLGQMLHEWAGHDLMHTVQAERALMQPFIAACGPWRAYFSDHDLAVKK